MKYRFYFAEFRLAHLVSLVEVASPFFRLFFFLCVCEGFVRDCQRSSTRPTFADRGPALVRARDTNVTTSGEPDVNRRGVV